MPWRASSCSWALHSSSGVRNSNLKRKQRIILVLGKDLQSLCERGDVPRALDKPQSDERAAACSESVGNEDEGEKTIVSELVECVASTIREMELTAARGSMPRSTWASASPQAWTRAQQSSERS